MLQQNPANRGHIPSPPLFCLSILEIPTSFSLLLALFMRLWETVCLSYNSLYCYFVILRVQFAYKNSSSNSIWKQIAAITIAVKVTVNSWCGTNNQPTNKQPFGSIHFTFILIFILFSSYCFFPLFLLYFLYLTSVWPGFVIMQP